MSDWNENGVTALNRYFNTYQKTQDSDSAIEKFNEEIVEQMANDGIEIEHSWSHDLSIAQLTDLVRGVASQVIEIKNKDSENKESYDDIFGPLHTEISNALSYAKDEKGDDAYENLYEIIDQLYEN